MKALSSFPKIHICPHFVDFRKRRLGLAAWVQEHLNLSPFGPELFIFMSRKRDCIRALYWDRTGFALWEKGLEEARFPWPKNFQADEIVITPQQAEWLLEGVDLWRLKPHRELKYSMV